MRSAVVWSLAVPILLAVAGAVVGCTSSPVADPEVGVDPAGTLTYGFDLQWAGDDERYELISILPVGRTAVITVSLQSQGESVDVDLEATVVRAGADGVSQDIALDVTAVRSDDGATIDGLSSIVGASSVVRRDQRHAVVEQLLDVPTDLGFRADAVARQALRAPFSLAGPLPVLPIGDGATWSIESLDGPETIRVIEVAVIQVDSDAYALEFELANGSVETVGRIGAMLPDLQVITLDDAVVTVTAERSN